MNLWQAFKMALRSIWCNKGRSVLTMLGIIIGIAAVMTIVSILQGQNKQVMEQLEAMGSNQIYVSAYSYSGIPVFEDLYDYCLQLDDLVTGVSPAGYGWGVVTYGVKNSNGMEFPPSIILGGDQYALCNNFEIAKGRDLSKLDIELHHQVCVLGSQAAKVYFDLSNPVGQEIQINGIPFTVIGVYAQKDFYSEPDWSMDNMMVLPYTAARTLGQDMEFMSEFVVKAKNSEATQEAMARISGFLTGLLGDPEDPSSQKGYFSLYSQDSWMEDTNSAANMMSAVLGGIAGISLLVGGIGIMNIMLVTVTERTREIGVRRAIGAKRVSIVTQFLIEAALICGIGGMIGAALGTVLTLIGSQELLGFQVMPTGAITVGSVLFAMVLGLIFGLYPAIKASGLQPVVALRAD